MAMADETGGPDAGSVSSTGDDGAPGAMSLRVGVVDVEQTAGSLIINDIAQYFDQRNRKIKQCPPHLYVLFKRSDGRRPAWGFNKAYIENPKLFLPGLENLAAGPRVASEVVPRSHQAFHFKVAADTSDDAYFEHDVRVVFSIKDPVRFIDTTGLDAKTPECAAHVGQQFFHDFMAPIIRARLDSLTKKVDSDGINTLNAHPVIVDRYMFNLNYDVDTAIVEYARAHEEGRPPSPPPAPDAKYDEQWRDFFGDYGVQLERFVSSIDQSEEIALANLQKAQARAAAERAKIDADVQLYVQQKKGEAAAAGMVAFISDLQDTLVGVFGDSVRKPSGFRYALTALAEFKALNDPEPGQRVFITTGGGGGSGPDEASLAELMSKVEAIVEDHQADLAAAAASVGHGAKPSVEPRAERRHLEPPAREPFTEPEPPAPSERDGESEPRREPGPLAPTFEPGPFHDPFKSS